MSKYLTTPRKNLMSGASSGISKKSFLGIPGIHFGFSCVTLITTLVLSIKSSDLYTLPNAP